MARQLSIVGALLALVYATPAGAASFRLLGDLPGGDFESVANGISRDGSTVVGGSSSGTTNGEVSAFYWNSVEGMVELPAAGVSQGKRLSQAFAVSGDGSCIVGESTSPNQVVNAEATLWRPGESPILGGFLSGAKRSVMFDVNDTCTRAVGAARTVQETAVDFAIDLGAGSAQIRNLGIPAGYGNAAARAIAGQADFVAGIATPFQDQGTHTEGWRRPVAGPFRLLGFAPGGTSSHLNALSDNGTVGAGASDAAGSGGALAPVRWRTDLKMQPLGLLPGFTSGDALGISAGGGTIVGRLDGPDGSRAFVWSQGLGGMRLLEDLLAERGVDLPQHVVLLEAVGIAADGQRVAGTAENANGELEAFVADLDAPEAGARIAAGEGFACGLFDQVDVGSAILDGTVCWGLGINEPPPTERLVALAAGRHTAYGLTAAGEVRSWGDEIQGQDELDGRLAREIRGGEEFACIRNSSDRLECTSGAPVEIASLFGTTLSTFGVGDDHVCMVRPSGAVACAGPLPDPDGRLTPPPGLLATRVFLGRNTSCAIERGTRMVKCWGSPAFGQSADPDGNHVQGSGGPNHLCTVQEPEAAGAETAPLYCQGRGAMAMPDGEATPPLGEFSAVAVGGDDVVGFTCALDALGRPACFGSDDQDGACPPGDEDDCDGIAAFADNCPLDANPDQGDADGDGVGDACDLCEGGIDSIDDDEDGFPDACDLCLGRALAENRECPRSVLYLVTPGEADQILLPPVGFASAFSSPLVSVVGASANGTDPEVFKLLLDCGQDTVRAAAGSFAVPSSASSAVVGNGCGRDGCPAEDPDDRLGNTVNGAASTVINLDDPDRGELADLTVGFKFRNDVNGLCGPGQVVRLADVLVFDNVPGLTPAFSLTGVTDELGALVEGDDPEGTELVLRGFATEPTLLVKFRPEVGGVPTETSVLGEAPFQVERILGSIVGATGILGCDVPDGIDACSGLPRFRCTTSGTVPQTKLPQNLDFASSQTFVLGPGVSTIPGVATNQVFISFRSKFTTTQGSRRAFNPGVTLPWLIGTIETDASGSPAWATSSLGDVLGLDSSCNVDPSRFDGSGNFIAAVQTLGGGILAADSDSESSLEPGLDPDGDGRTENDLCPFTADTNLDLGGRQSLADPDGSIPNGIGNDCECGDVNTDFRVDTQDKDDISSFLIGNAPTGFEESLCNVSGAASFSDAPGCGVEDVLEQEKNFQGIPTGIEGKCAAFTGAQ